MSNILRSRFTFRISIGNAEYESTKNVGYQLSEKLFRVRRVWRDVARSGGNPNVKRNDSMPNNHPL